MNRVPRWLGLAAGLIAILVVGWGAVHNSRLAERNEHLTESLRELQTTLAHNPDVERIGNLQQEIERLRAQNREVHQLRAEVAALRSTVKENEALRQENQRLIEAMAQQQAPAAPASQPETQHDTSDERTMSMSCINNLKQIGLSARVWANDNDGILPPDLISMTNELSIPAVLHCPSDQGRPVVANWSQFRDWHSSYHYLNPGGSVTEPMVLLARCTIHGHIALSDGSVQDGKMFSSGGHRLINRNGRWELDASQTQSYYERLMMERYGIVPTGPTNPAEDSDPFIRFRERYGRVPTSPTNSIPDEELQPQHYW
jgi:regulator of replication initiation timing